MITSRGTYTRVVQALTSSNSTAFYASVTANMFDGSPSTACALSWPSGLQSGATYVDMPWRMVPAPAIECRIFALAGLQGIPAGMLVELYGGATATPGTLLAASETVRFANGTIGCWIVRAPGDGWTHEYFSWRIYNDDGSGSPIAASTIVKVGELYASPAWDWPVGTWETKTVNPSQVNSLPSGVSRTVRRTPWRMLDVTIPPHAWATAAGGIADTLQDLLYDLIAQDVIAVIPRPELRGVDGIDDGAVRATAMLAALTDTGGLASDAVDDAYPLRLALQEKL